MKIERMLGGWRVYLTGLTLTDFAARYPRDTGVSDNGPRVSGFALFDNKGDLVSLCKAWKKYDGSAQMMDIVRAMRAALKPAMQKHKRKLAEARRAAILRDAEERAESVRQNERLQQALVEINARQPTFDLSAIASRAFAGVNPGRNSGDVPVFPHFVWVDEAAEIPEGASI